LADARADAARLRAALADSMRGWQILADAHVEGGWALYAPQFAKQYLDMAAAAVAAGAEGSEK